MKFKVNDLIINNSDHNVGDVPIGYITKVTSVWSDSVYFKDVVGDDRNRPSRCYSIVTKNDFDKILKDADKKFNEAKAELESLNKVSDHFKVNVGDKYRFTRQGSSFYGAEFIISNVNLNGVYYYSAIITDHTKDVGTPWCELTTDINHVFGSSEHNFEKI